MGRRRRYPELSRGGSHRETPGLFDGLLGQVKTWPPEHLSLILGPFQPCLDPFGDPRPLKLGDGRENVHLKFPGRRRGINAFLERDKRYPKDAQFIEQRDEMFQVPAEAVEPPADEDIDSASACVLDETVERGATVFRPADCVGVFDDAPLAGLGIAAELVQLVVGGLVSGADSGV